MIETWKPILGYEDYFEISSSGIVRRLSNNKILKPHKTYKGYLRIALCVNKVSKKYTIHRLVALTFIDNPENKEFVNHIDGNKLNNNVNNLEWSTRNENEIHAFINGLKHHKAVIQYDIHGNKIAEFESIKLAAKHVGISHSSISECCNGITKTPKNYIWKFK